MDDVTTVEFPREGVTTLGLTFEPLVLRCRAAGPGGRPLHVLIDTGTDPSAMDARLARRLAVRTGGSGLGSGAASDTVAFTEAVLPWLRLGDLQIRNLFAPALDMSAIPFPVDVVLGYNVLRRLALRIDYERGLLTLAHPDLGHQPPPGSLIMPIEFFEHFPAVRGLEVDGFPIPLATIDTGSNAALTLGPRLATELGLLSGGEGVTVGEGAGFGGATAVLRRSQARLRLGPFTLPDVELDASLALAGDFSRGDRANIGNRLLCRFAAVTLDYERGVIVLEPRGA